ncbi:hypothetical protein COB52_03100 [Candidatus Kaiserbacteria bacterium]|nr:MAG: hypothetical protein COB52_03100 [Candidatus Kaiserbacteria bacterium]
MKVSYEWINSFFKEGALPAVSEVEEKLTFHAFEIEGVEEVNGVSVIDVDILPNRAADCLSHRGIAREISALFNVSMKEDPLRKKIDLSKESTVKVTLEKDDSCSYYVAAHITGVEVKDSPEWLKARLEAIGQKPINNVVDATNYVLFELGRPTHVFDAKKFEGLHVGTRLSKEGEKITLLGGAEVELNNAMTVIIDVDSDKVVGIGGIKGGNLAEVDENTTDILIETANFNPTQTRLTAQALKLRTDASARFENNMADGLADYGIERVVEIILKIAGGELQGYTKAGELDGGNTEVSVNEDRISKLLGAKISTEEVEDIFTRLEFEYSKEGGEFKVKAPFERRDINIPEEVIEEVGRVYGYNRIESKQLDSPEREVGVNKKYAYSEIIKKTLTELGVTEVYLYSLRDSGEVKLLNSLASDKDHLRKNLSDGVKDSLVKNGKNMPLLGLQEELKIFEIGNVFGEKETTNVCVGVDVVGNKKKEERVEAILTNLKTHLENTLGIKFLEVTGNTFEFSLDGILDELKDVEEYTLGNMVGDISYKPASPYPFVLRDIATWVPAGVAKEEIEKIVASHSGELLKRNDLFDEFEKDGRISYAFHLVFQSMEETLTDKAIGEIMDKIEAEIEAKDGWEVR